MKRHFRLAKNSAVSIFFVIFVAKVSGVIRGGGLLSLVTAAPAGRAPDKERKGLRGPDVKK